MSQPIKLCVHELETVFESQTSKNDLNERVMVRCPWASPRRQTWCWALLFTQRVSPHSRSPHLRAPARSTPDKAPGAHNKNLLDYWKSQAIALVSFPLVFFGNTEWKVLKSIKQTITSITIIRFFTFHNSLLIVGKICFALLAKKVFCISTVAILNIKFCLGVLVYAA